MSNTNSPWNDPGNTDLTILRAENGGFVMKWVAQLHVRERASNQNAYKAHVTSEYAKLWLNSDRLLLLVVFLAISGQSALMDTYANEPWGYDLYIGMRHGGDSPRQNGEWRLGKLTNFLLFQ